jgi:hypothetical protein
LVCCDFGTVFSDFTTSYGRKMATSGFSATVDVTHVGSYRFWAHVLVNFVGDLPFLPAVVFVSMICCASFQFQLCAAYLCTLFSIAGFFLEYLISTVRFSTFFQIDSLIVPVLALTNLTTCLLAITEVSLKQIETGHLTSPTSVSHCEVSVSFFRHYRRIVVYEALFAASLTLLVFFYIHHTRTFCSRHSTFSCTLHFYFFFQTLKDSLRRHVNLFCSVTGITWTFSDIFSDI